MPRKQAFSGKQKKQQLQEKKLRKQVHQHQHRKGSLVFGVDGEDSEVEDDSSVKFVSPSTTRSQEVCDSQYTFFESKPVVGRSVEIGRYALKFRPESKQEIELRRNEARQIIHRVIPEYLECKVEDFFSEGLSFPIRPSWDYNLSKQSLEARENKYFTEYLKYIDENFKTSDLSYFELNLETWRQFWRVLEMSDVLLCVVDIRYPALLFPPKLYEYCLKTLGKNVIVVLNKVDIVPASLVVAWKEYFQKSFPGLEVLCFTSYEGRSKEIDTASGLKGRRRFRKLRMASVGALELYKILENMVAGQVNLAPWKTKILDEISRGDDDEIKIETVNTVLPDASYYEFKKFHDGVLTIGTIGQPNTGKSSLINGLMGKKVVSVSKTPGHTKHFQTIYLTSNVRLCDCPGLIFPSKVPKSLQVLCGSYPIAQLREPFSSIKYLAERSDLPSILKIAHPEGGREWSAFDITDGWAEKKGYHTAKTSRLDSYRAANHILRLALEGRIVLALRPPGYTQQEAVWKIDPRVSEIEKMQAGSKISELDIEESEHEEEEEEEDKASQENGETQSQANSVKSVFATNTSKFALLEEEND